MNGFQWQKDTVSLESQEDDCGAVAVSSNPAPLNVAVKLGLLMVPDKPESEDDGESVQRGSPDGWKVPSYHESSQ